MDLAEAILQTREVLGDKAGKDFSPENLRLAVNFACAEAAKATKATKAIIPMTLTAGQSKLVVPAIEHLDVVML
jgi:hypothetical protein